MAEGYAKGCKTMQISRDPANAAKMGPGAKTRKRFAALLLPTDLPNIHPITVIWLSPKLQETVRDHDPAARIR